MDSEDHGDNKKKKNKIKLIMQGQLHKISFIAIRLQARQIPCV